jgi:hypothetical protein
MKAGKTLQPLKFPHEVTQDKEVEKAATNFKVCSSMTSGDIFYNVGYMSV